MYKNNKLSLQINIICIQFVIETFGIVSHVEANKRVYIIMIVLCL